MEPRPHKVYVGGTFDLIHPGHIDLLRQAARLGDVWVALNTDEFVARYKGRPPIQTLEERGTIVRAIRYVHGVIVNTGDEDSMPSIQHVMPQFIVHGSDWIGQSLWGQMRLNLDWLRGNGVSIVYFDILPGLSSTTLRERVISWATSNSIPNVSS